MPSYTRYAILIAIAVPLLGISVYFVSMLKTAEAREVEAACNGLRGTDKSPTFAQAFPTAAKDFKLQDWQGKQVSLADYRGKVVLVNFWASWCKTCRSEKPSLESFASDLGNDVVVLALASDNDWQKVKGALPNGTNLTVLLDPPPEGDNFGPTARAYGIKAVPETFVIDKEGVVRHYLVNKRDWKSGIARTCVEALVRE